jgi:hypothetical protein
MAERNTKIRGNQIFDGTIGVDKLDVSNAPVAGYYLRYNSTSQKFEWVPGTGAVTEIPTLDTGSTYDLTATPLNGSLSIYLNGLFQEPGGSDYSLVGSKITFASPIDGADILLASYFTEVASPTDSHIQNSDTQLRSGLIDTDASGNLNVTGELKIKTYVQASEPILTGDHYLAIWVDSDDSNATYLVFRLGSGLQKSVELA